MGEEPLKNRAFAAAALLLAAAPLAAQDDAARLRERMEEERRQQINQMSQNEKTIDANQDLFFDYGGWLRAELLDFQDKPFKDRHTLRFWDLRAYGSARVYDIHRFYVRGLLQLSDFNSGDQFGARENDWRGANLDQAFYEIDLKNVAGDIGWDVNRLVARAGRQFMQVGRGITLNSVMDGIDFEGQWGYLGFKLLGAHPLVSTDDINRSRPDPDHTHRLFYGAELSWLEFPKCRFYGYGLVQRDLNDDAGAPVGVDYNYDSAYWGFGVRAEPISRTNVQAGYILESGRTDDDPLRNTTGEVVDDRVVAQSWNLLVQYFPNLPMQPRFSAEYLFGSGDADRLSVTNTVGGNNPGTVDRGFLPFGYVNTGVSLFPRLSNLNIFRVGGVFRPLEGLDWFDDRHPLEVGLDFFVYRKDKVNGVISDLRADVAERNVGDEVDASVTWRARSDLLFALKYGLFNPGSAYSALNDKKRNFVSVGLTYSF